MRRFRFEEAMGMYLYRIVHDAPEGSSFCSFCRSILLAFLRVLSFIYSALVRAKRSLYKYGVLKSHKLSRPVICLGNITLGGTGKTPTAVKLALLIRDMGFRVAVLNRGYRSYRKEKVSLVSDGEKIYMDVSQAGDEAYLLAKSLPGIMVVSGADRVLTGRYAIEEKGAQVIILDDGYQHWRLKRDMDIVLIDSLNPFGNGYTLPRGTLREPLASLDRADIFLLTKTNQSTKSEQNIIKNTLKKYNEKALIVESIHLARNLINIEEWFGWTPDKCFSHSLDLGNDRVLAFSALGNPASFERTLNAAGVKAAEFVRYPDHHQYVLDEMLQMAQKAADINAAALVTTEKDAVKIPEEFLQMKKIPVYILPLELVFHEGYREMTDALCRLLKERKESTERKA